MFDGDLSVLTFGNCVLKPAVMACETIRTFLPFCVFFQNPKNMTFYVFLSCYTRFFEHWVVSYSTSIDPTIVSVSVFEIFGV